MNPSKEDLRTRLKSARSAMNRDEVNAKSLLIAKKMMDQVDWNSVKTLHIYSSLPALSEVDTKPIIQALRRNLPQIEINLGSASRRRLPPDTKFDMIIVPVLGFDIGRNRLGMGGGWYDRFLAAQPQSLKIGLAFQAGFVKEGLPAEPHDITLDTIITEASVY